jgi:hypothetical protein
MNDDDDELDEQEAGESLPRTDLSERIVRKGFGSIANEKDLPDNLRTRARMVPIPPPAPNPPEKEK